MKPFDLEAAKRGDPICTEDNKPLRFICFDEVSNRIVYGYEGKRIAHTDFMIANTCIFMAPKKRTVWVNLYLPASGCVVGKANHYESERDADFGTGRFSRIGNKAYPVEIEE